MGFWEKNNGIYLYALILMAVLAVVSPLFDLLLTTVQNKMMKPYHKFHDGGNTLIIYFCQKHGYVPYKFFRKGGKWKRKLTNTHAVVMVGLLMVIAFIFACFLSFFYTRKINLEAIITFLVISFGTLGVIFAGIEFSQIIMLRKYIRENKL